MSAYPTKRLWSSIYIGLAIILFGLLLILKKVVFITWLSDVVGLILLLDAGRRLYKLAQSYWSSQSEQTSFCLALLIIFFECFLALFLMFYSHTTAYLLIKSIAVYHLFLAVINSISLILMVKNRADRVILQTLRTLTHYLLSFVAFFANESQLTILNIMGVYIILIGLTYVQDGRRVILSEQHENKIRRRIRFPMPIFLSVLLPRRVLTKINHFLENEFMTDQLRQEMIAHHTSRLDTDRQLEILIHVSRIGAGNDGHVNIAYQGKVYNFGNHDKDSRFLAGLIGDGVLAVVDKDKFFDVALASQDTIFEYVVALTADQVELLEKKLKNISDHLVEWELKTSSQKKGYGGLLKRRAGAQLYKFTAGKFKNYFVLGSNCVLLSDYLIGASGLDLFAMVGFLTPGTYFDYLNREYKKEGTIVVQRHVHSRRISKHLRNAQLKMPAEE